jgi:conjugal transfer pilus assembly protein TraD
MSENKGNNGQSDFIIWVIGAIAGVGVLYGLYQKILIYSFYHTKAIRYVAVSAMIGALFIVIAYFYNKAIELVYGGNFKLKNPDQILVGLIEGTNKPLLIDEEGRTYHTEVVGSTGTGKTEGVNLPWIFDDIENKRGIIIVDGKPEEKFLERVYGKAVEMGRANDFLLFSLAKPTQSHSFNPLASGSPSEVAERVFSSFSTDNAHYGSLQFSALNSVLKLIHQMGRIPKPGLVRELLKNKGLLSAWLMKANDPNLHAEFASVLTLPPEKFEENFSGLIAYFEHFTKSEVAPLLNQDRSEIDFENVILTKKIVYFQLPTLASPMLASILGKLVIQSFAASVGKLQSAGALNPKKLFSLYLDDFNDYIYKEFASVVSKVRSGGVGIVFAHQSLADLDKVSKEFKQAIVENTNNKIILGVNDPDSAEFFAKYTGTQRTEKTTERRTKKLFSSVDTGEQSVRSVEEFVIHPNTFKSGLKPLEGIAIIKSEGGLKRIERIRCVPVVAKLLLQPQNRTYPALQFVAEARMFGEKKDASQPSLAPPPKPSIAGKTQSNGGNENEEQTQNT